MFGIFESKEKGELALVFDIRSSAVAGALVRLHNHSVPKVLLSITEPITQEGNALDIDKFLSTAVKSIDAVSGRILKAGLGVPKKIFCILSSPWHVAQTRIVNFKKDKPFVFSLSLADELIKKEVAVFKKEHLEPYADTKEELRLMELHNIKTMLNGYATHKPLDQKAEEAELTLFVSVSSEHVLKSIEEAIKKHFHFESIKFASSTMATFSVLRNMFPKRDDFLLVEVGGELTDIAMVKKDVLRESISFPIGRYFITRSLATVLKVPENEAKSYLSLLQHGHADKGAEKKLGPALDKIKYEWLKKFQESLANLSQDISVPYVIYLSADQDFLDFFGQIITEEQFNQYALTESKFEIVCLGTETLHGIADFNKDTTLNPFILVDASYINHFLVFPEQSGQA